MRKLLYRRTPPRGRDVPTCRLVSPAKSLIWKGLSSRALVSYRRVECIAPRGGQDVNWTDGGSRQRFRATAEVSHGLGVRSPRQSALRQAEYYNTPKVPDDRRQQSLRSIRTDIVIRGKVDILRNFASPPAIAAHGVFGRARELRDAP